MTAMNEPRRKFAHAPSKCSGPGHEVPCCDRGTWAACGCGTNQGVDGALGSLPACLSEWCHHSGLRLGAWSIEPAAPCSARLGTCSPCLCLSPAKAI
jgi:hypothetical protein